ncbi:MAG: MBL fold metallo-hydrolase [Propionibacteriales bacterium]|nr:MBL fold metallo-hydrolase [Propionibacteriales bacterium]
MTSRPEFTEIADRVWVARYPWYDVNVGLVAGEAGLVVIDTNASDSLGRETLEAVRRISSAPLVAAVNTHVHFDHTLGNGVFAGAGAELIAHEQAAEGLVAHVADCHHGHADDPHPSAPGMLATAAVVPTRTFSSALAVDLGDRTLELIHPGRGHTDGDIVIRVPDADVLFAGDLVEESTAQSPVPGYGDDCFPMDWPTSLDLVLSLTLPSTRIVPGHGTVVDQDFVYGQRAAIGVVAETIRDLVTRGVPREQALEAGDWPYPSENMADAVRRGYDQLPGVRRQLPLI